MSEIAYTVRQTTEEDYEMLNNWGIANKSRLPPIDFLPDRGTSGLLVEVNGVPFCAGFLYLTNSPVGWLEYVVADFEQKDRVIRSKGLDVLIENLAWYAKDNDCSWIFSSVKNTGLIKKYLTHDFTIGSSGTKEMIKIL